MKIIISRKGFDSTYGGVPSPIFRCSDGGLALYPLPIPLPCSTCTYTEIQWNGSNLDQLISCLRPRKAARMAHGPHLDPDLDYYALRNRHHDWRPMFGQSGIAEAQLTKSGVNDPSEHWSRRPVFLFFGWYRDIESFPLGYRYVRRAQGKHAFFGWLQVERKVVLSNREDIVRTMPWTSHHPHIARPDYDHEPNAIYIAPKPGSSTDRLILAGRDTGLPAAGIFRRFDPEVHTLTVKGQARTIWRLPSWFSRNGTPLLGMHRKVSRWSEIADDKDYCQLKAVSRGQEFVFDSRDHDESKVFAWVEAVVRAGCLSVD